MSRPLDSSARVLARLGIGVLVVVVGGVIAGLFVARVWPAQVLTLVDRPVTRALVGARDPQLTTVMHAATWLGGTAFVTAVLAVAAVVSYHKTRRRRWPAFLVATILGAVALDNLVKYVINRPRPNIQPLVDPFGSSFPSGHSAAAAALCGSLAYLLTRDQSGAVKVWIWTTAAVVVVAVAVSRIYLGAHWLTDVIGGVTLGCFWTSVTAGATKYTADRPEVAPTLERAEPVRPAG